MTPTEAAKVIGCSPGQVRVLIRTGRIRARRKPIPSGYVWSISQSEVEKCRDTCLPRGWERGRLRK